MLPINNTTQILSFENPLKTTNSFNVLGRIKHQDERTLRQADEVSQENFV